MTAKERWRAKHHRRRVLAREWRTAKCGGERVRAGGDTTWWVCADEHAPIGWGLDRSVGSVPDSVKALVAKEYADMMWRMP